MSTLPVGVRVSIGIIALYALVAIFAPVLARYPQEQIFPLSEAPWSHEFWLGTDQLGRDVFSRLIYGCRNTVGIALAALMILFTVGSVTGLVAAVFGGWIDQALGRLADMMLSVPSLILTLMLIAIFGSSVWNLIIIIALVDSTRVFRLTRAAATGVVLSDFVEAARVRGEGKAWIMFREVLPNIYAPLLGDFGLRFCYVFLKISSLSFLGVGIQPPLADWGSMVRENASMISFARYDFSVVAAPLLPALAIAILAISVNYATDWYLQRTSNLSDGK